MSRTASKVVGVLLALLGLVLTGAGSWFAAHLGGSGTATFTAHPGTGTPFVVGPSVLNRVDGPVRLTATPAKGAKAWIAVAAPTDATAVIGDAAHTSATGVDVRDWTVLTTTSGSAPKAPAVSTSDVWTRQETGPAAVSMAISQADAPQTVVVFTDNGDLATVTVSWVHRAWFVQAVVTALVGLALLAGGALLLWPRPVRDEGTTSSSGTTRLGVAA